MKVTLDTNVILSGLLFPGGPPDRIVRATLLGKIEHCTSPDLMSELRRILEQKFKLPKEKVSSLISLIAASSTLIYPPERLDVIKTDPSDNRVLECALTANAAVIISGDAHLLKLKHFKSIPIIRPAEAVQRISR